MPMKMRLTVVIPFVYFVCRLFACGRIHTKREMVNNFCGFSRSPWLLIHFIFNAENIWCFGDEKLDATFVFPLLPHYSHWEVIQHQFFFEGEFSILSLLIYICICCAVIIILSGTSFLSFGIGNGIQSAARQHETGPERKTTHRYTIM